MWIQYSTVQYSTVQYSTVRYSTVQYISLVSLVYCVYILHVACHVACHVMLHCPTSVTHPQFHVIQDPASCNFLEHTKLVISFEEGSRSRTTIETVNVCTICIDASPFKWR